MKYLVLSALMLSACASISNGTSQRVTIDSEPRGALCQAKNSFGMVNLKTTPETVTVHRSYKPLVVNCMKGNLAGHVEVESDTEANSFGNILLGGGIGAAVDMSNGSAYSYPENVMVRLK